MTYIFDGKGFILQKYADLKSKVEELAQKGIKPRLVSILVGNDPASLLYLGLKKDAAEKIGAELVIKKFDESSKHDQVFRFIKNLNNDHLVHGIMIQIPLPDNYLEEEKDLLIEAISSKKDIDGLKGKSAFVTPVVRAVEEVLSVSEEYIHHNNYPYKIAVVGSSGFVGKNIIKRLKNYNPNIYSYIGLDNQSPDMGKDLQGANIIISATGIADLIKPSMIKDGVVLIDVGAPKGDISKSCYRKVCFVSPVPGGIGPMTIFYLLTNLVAASETQ